MVFGRGAVSAFVMVAAGLIGAGMALFDQPPQATATSSASFDEAQSPMEVHVTGHVLNPGVVRLGSNATVADAIAAAGGFAHGADPNSINLAAPVTAGDQILVPGPGSESSSRSVRGVSLNKASVQELQALPGVGPVLAERIVAFRDANGPFREVEDLLDVAGIGEAKLAPLQELVVVP